MKGRVSRAMSAHKLSPVNEGAMLGRASSSMHQLQAVATHSDDSDNEHNDQQGIRAPLFFESRSRGHSSAEPSRSGSGSGSDHSLCLPEVEEDVGLGGSKVEERERATWRAERAALVGEAKAWE